MGEGKTILLTGATGFVGGNLRPALRRAGHRIICASRDPARARGQIDEDEVRYLDVTQPESLGPAMRGCNVAYYLVHSMRDEADYESVERRAAADFAASATEAGIQRIVYLGGVQPQGKPSRHLRSRLATGETLREGHPSTVELRASMIIGGGSESWRIVRDLAARLPVMILPRWLDNESQPVALPDVIDALVAAAEVQVPGSAAYDIPGPEALSGREILFRTADLIGVRPRALRVPVVTPRLSSYWIGLVTRADGKVARELVEGLSSGLLATGPMFWQFMDDHPQVSFSQAAEQALEAEASSLTDRARRTENAVRELLRWVTRRRASNQG